MKLTAKIMSNKEGEPEDSAAARVRHYYLCVLTVYSGDTDDTDDAKEKENGRPTTCRYSLRTMNTITWLAIAQIISGIALIGMQCVTTYYSVIMTGTGETTRGAGYYYRIELSWNEMDELAPGIWCGVFIVISGVVGLVSRKNTKCLIITHLIWSVIALLFAITVVAMAICSTSAIVDCKNDGSDTYAKYLKEHDYGYDNYKYKDGERTITTAAPPETVDLFGEEFTVNSHMYNSYDFSAQRIFCESTMFTNWLALEISMALCGLLVIGASLWSLICTSLTLCKCCTSDNKEDKAALIE